MSLKLEHEILSHSIEEFDVSENFLQDFHKAGFSTLAEALVFDADELVQDKKFSLHTITELITLLNNQGLGRLLRD
ncbi:MAG TPA: hypothetical protein PLJ60_11725 [Chryseolinea sp.]|nr:hypothetical protein [Chryseolinea sp.]HPM30993.1 hypothetical protein [Chryseolinea sp.]